MPRRPTDDEDDRPRRRRPAPDAAGGGSNIGLWVGLGLAGVLGLAAVGGAAWWLLRPKPAPVVVGPGPAGPGEPNAKPGPAAPPKTDEPPQLTPAHKFKTGVREISALYVSSDGSRVAVRGDTLSSRPYSEVWDLAGSPKKVRDLPRTVAALSADGSRIVLAREGGADLADAITGEVVAPLPTVVEWSAAGETFVGARFQTEGKSLRLIVVRHDSRTGRLLGEVAVPVADYGVKRAVVGGGRELVVAEANPLRVDVWNLETGKRVRGAAIPGAYKDASWHNFAATADGTRVTAGWKSTEPVRVFDTATGQEVATMPGHPNSVAFVPGRNLLMGHDTWVRPGSQTANGWRAYDLDRKARAADLPGAYLFPAASADGKVMVTRVDRTDPHVLVWDLTRLP